MKGFDVLQALSDHDNSDIRTEARNILIKHPDYDYQDIEEMNALHNQSAAPISGHDQLVENA